MLNLFGSFDDDFFGDLTQELVGQVCEDKTPDEISEFIELHPEIQAGIIRIFAMGIARSIKVQFKYRNRTEFFSDKKNRRKLVLSELKYAARETHEVCSEMPEVLDEVTNQVAIKILVLSYKMGWTIGKKMAKNFIN